MKPLQNLTMKGLLSRIEKEFNSVTNGNFGAVISIIAPGFYEPYDLCGMMTQSLSVVLGLYDEKDGRPYSQQWELLWDAENGGFHTLHPTSERSYSGE